MFPFSFEWIWDMSHGVFMGGLWFALSVIGAGMTFCVLKAAHDTFHKGEKDHHHH